MNLKIKAGLIVAGILSSAIATIIAVRLALTYISLEMLPNLFISAALSIALYTLYSITLDRLKYETKIKEMVDKKFN